MKPILLAIIAVTAMVAVTLVTNDAGAATPDDCTILGTPGDDTFGEVHQTAGDDVVCGLGGNDLFYGFTGNDTYRGGLGRDTVSYIGLFRECEGCFGGVDIHLGEDTAHVSATEEDLLRRIENAEGSRWRDQFTDQDGERNKIDGKRGRDFIYTFDSVTDRIDGGTGIDGCYVDEFDIYRRCERVHVRQ
jgi:Ca2+-binding RTX toxin-like protein